MVEDYLFTQRVQNPWISCLHMQVGVMPTPVQMSCGMYLLHSWYFNLLLKILSLIFLFLYYASISIRIISM